MHITLIAGTRPNFVKIAAIIHAIKKVQGQGVQLQFRLVHTGQHYDRSMSGSFFEDLNIPEPDSNLEVGSGTQAEQTGAIMIGFEKELQLFPTDLVLVVGDVTSTMACAIVAKKMNLKLAHVEGGIRSFDSSMPEEINRKVTDSITDVFFTTSRFANENLRKEGVEENKIHFVGNVMIDTLLSQLEKLRKPEIFDQYKLDERNYLVLTLHRPANVDDPGNLRKLLSTIQKNSLDCPIIFPVHPRTKKVMTDHGISVSNLITVHPLAYSEFNYLVKNAFGVITDSGGITEETTVLGIPCLTLRDNTERPETCTVGTNELIGTDPALLPPALHKLFSGNWKKGTIPERWDGKSAERIVEHLIQILNK
jgi:UDP-N-acetylglucosamine 2-epimerase (non-hydrolysing)